MIGNANKLQQVFMNLLLNARDAMPNGGEIRISTERWVAETAISGSAAPRIYVRVRVKDSGQGMPAEVVRNTAFASINPSAWNPARYDV